MTLHSISGAVLKRALKKNDLTQEAAAIKLGVSRPTLNKYCGQAVLDEDVIEAVRDRLGIDLLKHVNTGPSINQYSGKEELKQYGQKMFKEYAQFFGFMAEMVEDHDERLSDITQDIIELKAFRVKIDERVQALEERPKP